VSIAHSTALTVIVNWSIPFLAIGAAIGLVAFCTRSREPRADDAKHGRRQ